MPPFQHSEHTHTRTLNDDSFVTSSLFLLFVPLTDDLQRVLCCIAAVKNTAARTSSNHSLCVDNALPCFFSSLAVC